MRGYRDDAIENESNTINLVFKNSLVDGTYMGFACRPAKGSSRYDMENPPDATLTIEDTLLRLEAMPYRVGKEAPDGWGHGHLFKWSAAAPKKVVIRNSIFVVERQSCQSRSAMRFPEGTVCQNVTLIWLGGGVYPGNLPESGVTVTDDVSIWQKAKAAWLKKHGYNPDPKLPPAQNLMPLVGRRPVVSVFAPVATRLFIEPRHNPMACLLLLHRSANGLHKCGSELQAVVDRRGA